MPAAEMEGVADVNGDPLPPHRTNRFVVKDVETRIGQVPQLIESHRADLLGSGTKAELAL